MRLLCPCQLLFLRHNFSGYFQLTDSKAVESEQSDQTKCRPLSLFWPDEIQPCLPQTQKNPRFFFCSVSSFRLEWVLARPRGRSFWLRRRFCRRLVLPWSHGRWLPGVGRPALAPFISAVRAAPSDGAGLARVMDAISDQTPFFAGTDRPCPLTAKCCFRGHRHAEKSMGMVAGQSDTLRGHAAA